MTALTLPLPPTQAAASLGTSEPLLLSMLSPDQRRALYELGTADTSLEQLFSRQGLKAAEGAAGLAAAAGGGGPGIAGLAMRSDTGDTLFSVDAVYGFLRDRSAGFQFPCLLCACCLVGGCCVATLLQAVFAYRCCKAEASNYHHVMRDAPSMLRTEISIIIG